MLKKLIKFCKTNFYRWWSKKFLQKKKKKRKEKENSKGNFIKNNRKTKEEQIFKKGFESWINLLKIRENLCTLLNIYEILMIR